MSNASYTSRHAMGKRVIGQALVASDGLSARYDLNRLKGVFSRPTHKLVGQNYIDKILVLDTAKGGVATAWMLHEMRSRNMCPSAIVFNTVNTILAQGAALGDVTMLAGFDIDITTKIPHGAMVEVDPEKRSIRVLSPEEYPTFSIASGDTARVHGPR